MVGITALPLEIIDTILADLDQPTLASLVRANHYLQDVGLPHLYAHTRLPPSKPFSNPYESPKLPCLQKYANLVRRVDIDGAKYQNWRPVYNSESEDKRKAPLMPLLLSLAGKPNVKSLVWTGSGRNDSIIEIISSLSQLRFLALGTLQTDIDTKLKLSTGVLQGLQLAIEIDPAGPPPPPESGPSDDLDAADARAAENAQEHKKKQKEIEDLARNLLEQSGDRLEGLDIAVTRVKPISRVWREPGKTPTARRRDLFGFLHGNQQGLVTIGTAAGIVKDLRFERLKRLRLGLDITGGENTVASGHVSALIDFLQTVPWSQLTILELDGVIGGDKIFAGLSRQGISLSGLKKLSISGTMGELEEILPGMPGLEELLVTVDTERGIGVPYRIAEVTPISDALVRVLANLHSLKRLEVFSRWYFTGDQLLSMTQGWPWMQKLTLTVNGSDWSKHIGALCTLPDLTCITLALEPTRTPLDPKRANPTLAMYGENSDVYPANENGGPLHVEHAVEARARGFMLDLVQNIFQSAVVRVPLDRELSPAHDVKLQTVGVVLGTTAPERTYSRQNEYYQRYQVVSRKRQPRWALPQNSNTTAIPVVPTLLEELEAVMAIVAGWEVGLVKYKGVRNLSDYEDDGVDEVVLFGRETKNT